MSNLLPIPVYKVNHLVNGKINTIFVFYGSSIKEKDKKEIIKKVFTEKEIINIQKNSIKVIFSEQQIHFDDSIGMIKIKILEELKRIVSLEEIYLFCEKIETIQATSLYQSITQNKKIELTKLRLEQFLSNVVSNVNGEPFSKPLTKETYDYPDILQLKINEQAYIVNKGLGQKFFIVENEYPFVCNPFNVNNYDPFFERVARKSTSTLNNHLLLNTGTIVDNNIYLCLAKDVLTYLASKNKNISEENTIKIYYPFLYSKNVYHLDELEEMRPKLIEGNNKIANPKTFDNFKTIDMFYDVYKLQKKELNYLDKGITFIKATLNPKNSFTIPLEVIFKILHATEQNPLIKYNPSSRQENIYRLYTDKNATDGRKIPYLKKAVIFKLIKNIGKTKSVSVYVENVNDKIESLICEFNENGSITIFAEFKKKVLEKEVEEIFIEYVNPVIGEIKSYLEQSGYKMEEFHSLQDENVEIEQMTFAIEVKIAKPMNLDELKGCVSSVFINESSQFKQDIHLRFKRVANFNKVTSQEAFILEKQEEGLRGNEIIDALLDNFQEDLTRQDAEELVRKVANEVQVERGVRKTDIKIKNNPGFKTILKTDKKTNLLTISVENINDIYYLSTVPIYLDTLIRLTQNKGATKYPLAKINTLCSSGEKEDIQILDIVSPIESYISEQEEPDISDNINVEEELEEELEGEKKKNAFSLFFGDDEEEEEEEEKDSYKGGVKSESESSVSSFENDSEKVSTEPSVSSEKSLPPLNVLLASPSNLLDSPVSSEKSVSSVPVSLTSPVSSEKVLPSLPVPLTSPLSSEKVLPSLPVLLTSPVSSEKVLPSLPVLLTSPVIQKTEPIKLTEKEEEPEKEEEKEEPEKEEEKEPEEEEEKEPEEEVEEEKEVEEEEEEEEETEEEEEHEKNIDGMSLRNYFQTQIEEKDKKLIVKQDVGNYSSYSKVCQSSTRRQPVIISDSELDKINKEHKGFLRDEDIIKYGSDKKKQYNYICPRYWCLKTKTVIDPSEFKEITENGKKVLVHPTCGKIIPEKADKIPKGHYVYEFYSAPKGKPDYKRYPNFQVNKHPDGYCLPCCFDKWNTAAKIASKNKCYQKETKEDVAKEKEKDDKDDYIKGPDKFPLKPMKWGYLPAPIQTILHEVNADCQISKSNTNLKQNHPCLLRHGVEINEKQSFIACISDALFFAKRVPGEIKGIKEIKILTITEMKQRIIQSLQIDEFIKYQNGNLVNDFHESLLSAKQTQMGIIDKYKNTKLYSKLDMNKKTDVIYYKKVVSAFDNFIQFLNDDNVSINHEYLWDIICKPNKYIFPEGRNLVILNIPNNDITNNVEIICPSNHYSNEMYDARKPTLFLIKQDNYYEPLYSYTISEKSNSIQKAFSEYDPNLSKSIKAVFKEIVKPLYRITCKPLESMPNVYSAKMPFILSVLIQRMHKYKYKIIQKVLNFRNKIIGVVAEDPDNMRGFVPCYPSAISEEAQPTDTTNSYVLMSETHLWTTYENTFIFLTKLYKKSIPKGKNTESEKEIPCKPIYKIVEDELVVGILTNSNQFVQITPPIPESEVPAEYNIPSFKNTNYIVDPKSTPNVQSDIFISTHEEVDQERVVYIEKIKLETNFYNVFRNTIRVLLNDYENVIIREKIEEELAKEYIIYTQKLIVITDLLKKLVENKIQFIGDENYYKLIKNISTCIVKNEKQCTDTPNLCTVTENGVCNLILPEKNLMTQNNNKEIYYGKMADELVRYNRIKSFIFKPQAYLSFGNVSYNLRDNEIILLQSLITQEYFETFVPATINKYITNNSYDEAKPQISQVYDNVVTNIESLTVEKGELETTTCKKDKPKISSSLWKTRFPGNYKEIQYDKIVSCTFDIIIDMAKDILNKTLTINQIKNDLLKEYERYFQSNPPYNMDKIVDILILQGKKKMGDQVRSEKLSFQHFIYADTYFLTPFDIWVLVQKYKIPTIIVCQKFIMETDYKRHAFVAFGEKSDAFIFILIPGLKPESIPAYKIILNKEEEMQISLSKLKQGDKDKVILDAFDEKISVEKFLDEFTKKTTTKYVKKKPLLIIEDTEEEEKESIPKKQVRQIVEEILPVPDELIDITKAKTKKVKKNIDKRKTKKILNKKLLIIESESKSDKEASLNSNPIEKEISKPI